MSKTLAQIHLRDLLSPSISADPVMDSGAAGTDPELQRALADIPLTLIYSAIDTLDEAALDLLAWGFHVDFYRPDLALAKKRDLVKGALPWHIVKGTGPPLQALIEAATTVEPEIREYPQFLCDWSELDQDLIVDAPDNFRLDVIMDRDDSAAAGVDRDQVQEMAEEMSPERSRSGVQTRFLGFRCDDPVYSQLDVDLLGS
jgi:phage tail P2-like protein